MPGPLCHTPTETLRSADRYWIALVYEPSKARSLFTTISLGYFARSVGAAPRSSRTMSGAADFALAAAAAKLASANAEIIPTAKERRATDEGRRSRAFMSRGSP